MSDSCPKKKLGIRVRQVGEEYYLVDFMNTYKINDITVEILKKCDGTNTVDDIVNYLSKKYPDTEKDMIVTDVKEVIEGFKAEQLVS